MRLRPYQERAVARTLAHFRQSSESACLVLPTGSGKSLVIAELARLARGRVIVAAHVKELCAQNYDKFCALGAHAGADLPSVGLFSAGLGQKSANAKVTFASVQSLDRHLRAFDRPISLLVIDECHRVGLERDSQYGRVIDHFRNLDPNLKVLGLTATPYRLGLGFCYRVHCSGRVATDDERPFDVCIDEVSLAEMVRGGYLTAPKTVEELGLRSEAHYDYLERDASESAQSASVGELDRFLGRHPRVTAAIVEHIQHVTEVTGRRGVMIFAATVQHAEEILALLPKGQAGLVVGDTASEQRDRVIQDFREQKLTYLVNVAVLTTGFDAPHVDFIAILRQTESVALFQQIVGRGLRLAAGKEVCLVADYAANGFDLYSPQVDAPRPSADASVVTVECPRCAFDNHFWGKLDDAGRVIEHHGRRCQGSERLNTGERRRCPYRFRFKECPKCQAENDIAARRCCECRCVLVDPDDMLRAALKERSSTVLRVAGVSYRSEGELLWLTYHDEDGASLSERFDMSAPAQRRAFNRVFARRLAAGRRPLSLETAEQAVQLRGLMPVPDFVIARPVKTKSRQRVMRVEERLFDYAGLRRVADR